MKRSKFSYSTLSGFETLLQVQTELHRLDFFPAKVNRASPPSSRQAAPLCSTCILQRRCLVQGFLRGGEGQLLRRLFSSRYRRCRKLPQLKTTLQSSDPIRMLYIIGLGLGNEKDITLKGLEAVRKCQKVYMEAYTSLLSFGLSTDGLSNLEELYCKAITLADREMVEEKADDILSDSRDADVAFLVVGDPFGATTHTDLVVRAKKMGIDVKIVHNASVMNAIGICGLQLYRYGETVSIPFFTETWRPDSFYEKIQKNQEIGLHTLCLLDIRVKEPSLESLCRGKKVYEPPRYMTINTAIEQLLEIGQAREEPAYTEDTVCVGFARLGSEDQMIVAGTMRQLQSIDFGAPLHCLVITGKTHPLEEEMLNFYRCTT